MFHSLGIHLTVSLTSVARQRAVMCLSEYCNKSDRARPLQQLRTAGRLSLSASSFLPKLVDDRSWCSSESVIPIPSPLRMLVFLRRA